MRACALTGQEHIISELGLQPEDYLEMKGRKIAIGSSSNKGLNSLKAVSQI